MEEQAQVLDLFVEFEEAELLELLSVLLSYKHRVGCDYYGSAANVKISPLSKPYPRHPSDNEDTL